MLDERRQQNVEQIERIAKVEQQIISIVGRLDIHEKNDEERFEINLNYMKDMEGRINTKLIEINTGIKQTNKFVQILWDEKNKREGALGLGKFLAAGIGGAIVALADWAMKR